MNNRTVKTVKGKPQGGHRASPLESLVAEIAGSLWEYVNELKAVNAKGGR